jgi:hypothetical protein
VQIPALHSYLRVVLGKVLRHPLGQGGDQHPLAPRRPLPDLVQEVVDLTRNRPHFHLGIGEPRGADDLLHHHSLAALELIGSGSGGYVDRLADAAHELGEVQRAVVEGRGHAKTVLHQGLLARAVAVVHAPHLGNGLVRLVDHHHRVLGQIVHQRGRRLPRLPAGEVARIVLDTVAVADFLQHLQIEQRALLEPLSLEELPFRNELPVEPVELLADRLDGLERALARGDVVGLGEDRHPAHLPEFLAGQRVELGYAFHLVPEELDSDPEVVVAGDDLDDVPTDAERAPLQVVVVALVLDLDQLAEDLGAIHLGALVQVHQHPVIRFGRAEAVDAGDARYDEHVFPLEERPGRRKAHAVDLVVDGGFFLDVGVARGDVGLGLIVIVVADEVFDGVIGEELLELLIELSRERLVVGDDQRRAVHRLDHFRHRERLARARHSQ